MIRIPLSGVIVLVALASCKQAQRPKSDPPASSGQITTTAGNSDSTPQDTSNSNPETEGTDGSGKTLMGCESDVRSSDTVDVTFSAADHACMWGVADNFSGRDGLIRARLEEVEEMTVPEGRELCDLAIESESSGDEFADQLLLTLNGVVLASSADLLSNFSKDDDDLPAYEWKKLRDLEQEDFPEGSFCLKGASACEVPKRDGGGKFKLEFSEDTNTKLIAQAKKAGKLKFALVTTGDHDTRRDCRHGKITLKVTYTYPKSTTEN